MTKLKFINKFILQWFFIRLTKCIKKVDKVDKYLSCTSCDTMRDGGVSARGFGKFTEYYWYSIQGFIVPTTGWNSDFKIIGKRFFIKLTKKYIKD